MDCSRCGDEQPTVKHMEVFEVQKILIVCLKRFSETAKKDCAIEVPFEIDEKDLGIRREGVKCRY